MKFSINDKAMLDEIKSNPKLYKVYVDNDCISVSKANDENFDYSFSKFGYYFALQLLCYIGIDTEFV